MYWSVLFVMLGEAAVFHSVVFAEWAAGFLVGVTVFVLLYPGTHPETEIRRGI